MEILIVDDSGFSRKITAALLQKYLHNVKIYFANDGVEGFKSYKELQPDYIFVDLLMPNLSGMKLIKLLKEYDHKAKIIVLSADVQKSIKNELEQYNIVAFINKPFNEEKAKAITDYIRNDINE